MGISLSYGAHILMHKQFETLHVGYHDFKCSSIREYEILATIDLWFNLTTYDPPLLALRYAYSIYKPFP